VQTHLESVIRPAAVAGLFYPADPTELRSIVDRLLWNSRVNQRAGAQQGTLEPAEPNALAANVAAFPDDVNEADAVAPKALISPHAGYVYSGAVAAAAYRLLARARGKVSRVVLLGPSHRFPFSGMAATSARAYETPLGVVPIDQQCLEQARDVPYFGISDEAHVVRMRRMKVSTAWKRNCRFSSRCSEILGWRRSSAGMRTQSRSPIYWTGFGAGPKRSSSFHPICRITLITKLVAHWTKQPARQSSGSILSR
jgi:hypothetical protein